MHSGLSFEQAPPVASTFRFFLTAPWFGMGAGLMLAWGGAPALASRWTPDAIALTHLLTVGFMLQAMCGALLQMVPVLTGENVWRPRHTAAFVHASLATGSILLVVGLAFQWARLLPAAETALGLGLAAFIVSTGWPLVRTAVGQGGTGVALRIALAGLGATAIVGILLGRFVEGRLDLPLLEVVDLHAALGLGAWALVLLGGVSFTVVPMFQLTPPYPKWIQRGFPAGIGVLASLKVVTVVAGIGAGPATDAIKLAAALLAAAFALGTLQLQQRRRRASVDSTFMFFRGAMIALLLADAVWILRSIGLSLVSQPGGEVLIGALLLVGVFVSAISGMLYKIVPFISWLKLSTQRQAAALSMESIIGEGAMQAQMRLHFIALALLVAAVPLPWLTRIAGAVFAVSCGWLGVNLAGGALRYVRTTRRTVAGRQ